MKYSEPNFLLRTESHVGWELGRWGCGGVVPKVGEKGVKQIQLSLVYYFISNP